MGGRSEPLVATGATTREEDAELDAAIAAYRKAPVSSGLQADFADYAKPLINYVSKHPGSAWNAALFLNLGIGYYHAGYFTRALESWQQAWELGRNATTPQARLMVDRAVGELARMHARLGHAKELEKLFAEIGNRPIGGPATEMIQGAREALGDFHNDPGVSYLCGPKALRNLLKTLKFGPEDIKLADDARSGPHGFSLTELAALADQTKLSYKLVYRKPGQRIPVPSVINWKAHHYAAITGKQEGHYEVIDPTFGGPSGALLTANAIDAEGSGYFMVPEAIFQHNSDAGWRAVEADSKEARAVYGMGVTHHSLPGATTPNDPHLHCDSPPSPAPGASSCAPQMTVADAITMPVSLNLTDTPVGYRPQKGPSALVTLFYNQREDQQPATFSFSNVSSKWTFSWIAYIQDDPTAVGGGSNVTRYVSGGGGIAETGYQSGSGAFTAETYDNSQLVAMPAGGIPTSYQRNLPDGSVEVYGFSNGATGPPRLLFLTQVIDPAGNTTTLSYTQDSQNRVILTSVTDAMGRSTTFSYGLSDPTLVTKITDPFGRYTQLNYDTNGRLSSITDPIGITSSFQYLKTGEPTFVTNLTTPYGNSIFADDLPHDNNNNGSLTRALTMTGPLGHSELLYFYQDQYDYQIPDDHPSSCFTANISFRFGRNTYYWDQHAFTLGVVQNPDGTIQSEDGSKAYITHWLKDKSNDDVTGRVPEVIKRPLESGVWYEYPDQPNNAYSGFLDHPIAFGRKLDDGTTQCTTATYNSSGGSFGGKPTSVTDALGRQTKFTYDSNNIDLLTVQQKTSSSNYTTIATFSNYNSQHEPQTYVGADGQTWHYSYNAAGQLHTITDPNSGTTTFNYDSLGRLSNIQNANNQTALTLTYDAADRVRTRADSEGYTLTYDYDNLDRVTQITYPDGTTDRYDWTFQSGPFQGTPSLELRKHTDRLGRVTTYDYDADRRLISVTEPVSSGTNRTTYYDYYENGVLKDITDANGNVTHWEVDLESRPTSKTYAYGTANAEAEMLVYEQTTSRLKSLTDALGQMKSYIYGLDDRLTGISYAYAANFTAPVSFAYDPYFPRLSSMTDGTGTTTYGYVPVGTNGALQLQSEVGPYGNDSIAYGYDALGRMSSRNIPGGNEGFGYDAINRLSSHSSSLGSFTYQYQGQTDQVSLRSVTNGGTTISTSWGYDTNVNDRRLISINNSGISRSYTLSYLVPGGGGAQNPYDILSITDVAAPGHPWATQPHGYGYDLSDRLVSATFSTPMDFHGYSYDPADNPVTVTIGGTQTHATYNALNEIVTWGTASYSYDANGNLSSDGTRTFKWDAENRLVEIDYGGTAKSQFSYDGLGRRIVDTEVAGGGGTAVFRYLWCDNGHLCQTRDGADNVLRRDLDEGECDLVVGQKLIYMPDQLGSVRDVLDGTTGALLDSYDYAPYGSNDRSHGNTPTDYRFADLLYHSTSVLNLGTYRAMDTVTGRFINRDPIGFYGGLNLYAYLDGSPVRYEDPTGLYPGQLPPPPPGYDPSTWKTIGQYENGRWAVVDPDGNIWSTHSEDDRHWRHWDKQPPGGRTGNQTWPTKCVKPWPNQKKLGPLNSPTDPNGNAPAWSPRFIAPPLGPYFPFFPNPGFAPGFSPNPGFAPGFVPEFAPI